jgi:hypothetical protein
MFKICACAVTLGSMLCLLAPATGPPALALDRHVQLTNSTRMVIVEFYASRGGSGNWQQDILGEEFLPPGQSVVVDIDDQTGYCRFDLKAVFDDGTNLIRRNVNICDAEGYAVSHR